MPSLTVSSPDLRPSLRSLLCAFSEAEAIERFVTTIGFRADSRVVQTLGRLSPKLGALVRRRSIPSYLSGKTTFVPAAEAINQLAVRSPLSDVFGHRVWMWAEPYFDRQVARRFAARTPILYGHEHACAESFRVQKRAGGLCVLRQVMCHYEFADSVADEELSRFPEAGSDYSRVLRETRGRVNERKREEYDLADLIVVNSDFARNTFLKAGVGAGRVVAIPTGCPPVRPRQSLQMSCPMVFLHAGHLSLRKGTPYLLKAWTGIRVSSKVAQLHMAGKVMLPPAMLQQIPPDVALHGQLSAVDLDTLYEKAAVLIVPSLCEGLAHVIPEAMSRGLAVIATAESGAEGLVEDGRNGWIISARDAGALADRISWCIENPGEVRNMGQHSLINAQQWSLEQATKKHVKAVVSCAVS